MVWLRESQQHSPTRLRSSTSYGRLLGATRTASAVGAGGAIRLTSRCFRRAGHHYIYGSGVGCRTRPLVGIFERPRHYLLRLQIALLRARLAYHFRHRATDSCGRICRFDLWRRFCKGTRRIASDFVGRCLGDQLVLYFADLIPNLCAAGSGERSRIGVAWSAHCVRVDTGEIRPAMEPACRGYACFI